MNEIKYVQSEDTLTLRTRVFSSEQGYPQEKIADEHEKEAEFIAYFANGEIAGCARFYRESETAFHIDNIAFDKTARGKGLGKELIAFLCGECRRKGAEQVTVNAKSEAVIFYKKCGFSVNGEEYADENFLRTPLVVELHDNQ